MIDKENKMYNDGVEEWVDNWLKTYCQTIDDNKIKHMLCEAIRKHGSDRCSNKWPVEGLMLIGIVFEKDSSNATELIGWYKERSDNGYNIITERYYKSGVQSSTKVIHVDKLIPLRAY